MGENRGKQFETVVKEAFEKTACTNIIRLHDQTSGFRGSVNPCDFIVYRYPYQYAIECKSVNGNTFPLSNITDNQWNELTKMGNVPGVIAGVLCWWVEKGITKFIPIRALNFMRVQGYKSIRYDAGVPFGCEDYMVPIEGKRKRIFFEYDMEAFFETMEEYYGRRAGTQSSRDTK